jgi:hypothetical protein
MPRKYLLIQHLKFPVPEHAMIEDRIRANSNGDFKQVFSTANKSEGGVVMYLFTSDLPMKEMSFGPLMREDRALVVEVTGRHVEMGMNVAKHWLQARRED